MVSVVTAGGSTCARSSSSWSGLPAGRKQAGFALVPALPDGDVPAVRVGASEKVTGQGRRISVSTVLFDGLLEVTDPGLFRQAIRRRHRPWEGLRVWADVNRSPPGLRLRDLTAWWSGMPAETHRDTREELYLNN